MLGGLGLYAVLMGSAGTVVSAPTQTDWTVLPPGGASLSITHEMMEDAPFAPAAVVFEATPSGFGLSSPSGAPAWHRPEMHDVFYEWDFGDAGSTFDVPENFLEPWRNANRAFTQCAAHVYSAPGTYTVTCTARTIASVSPINVVEVTATATVTVEDAEDYFGLTTANGGSSQERTIVVAKDGDFTGAPGGSVQATTEGLEDGTGYKWFSKAILEWMQNEADDPADAGYIRILFKRGETYTENLDHDERFTNGIMRAVYFGSWGNPADPPPKFTQSSQGVIRNEFGFRDPVVIWDGLDFEGDYDSVTQTAGTNTLTGIGVNTGAQRLITNCRISKHSGGVSYIPPRDEADQWTAPRIVIHSTEMFELASYGLYAEDRNAPAAMTDVVILGCKDIDVGNAPSGGTGTIDGDTNSQGPVRVWGRGRTIIDGCDFFGRYGWSGAGSWADGADVTAAQALRCPSNGTFDGTGRTFLTRVAFEGGGAMLVMGSAVATTAPFGNAVVDGFLYIGAASSRDVIGTEMGGVTVRNGLMIKPASVNSEVKPLTKVIGAGTNKAPEVTIPAENFDAPIRVHNCSMIVLDTSADQTFPFLDAPEFTDTDVANCVIYAPNYASQPDHLDIAPFDATELFGVRWLGRMEVADNGVLQTDYAAPAGSVSLYRPEMGSPVVQAVTTGRVGLFDLLGTPRPATPSLGAIEPVYGS